MMDKNSIQVYLTAKDTKDRLSLQKEAAFHEADGNEKNVINLYSEVEYQELIGFGGAFTESAADSFYKLSREKRDEVLRSYFDKRNGNGYTFCRTQMNSSDFSVGNYSCDDVPGDVSLANFQIDRDKKQLIPMIREALGYGPLNLFFSPWSPPAWMKSNGKMNNGGKLLPEYRQAWADFYARFVKSYRDEGIQFWGLTVQNEPMATQTWDSCIYTAEEEAAFVKDYLAPALRKNGLGDLKIMIWDHNKDILFDRAAESFSDKEAADLIWGMGFHWYGGDHFEALDAVHKQWPDKHLVFTEGCQEGGPTNGGWAVGERYGHEIIGDLNNFTSAWCDWNLLLDTKGGPNHVSNFCDAPILADYENNKLIYETSYWYIGHFSRFIKPGSVRICHTNFSDALECTAFKNLDGTIALAVMNKNDKKQDFTLRFKNQACKLSSPAHSIMTVVFPE